MRRGLLQDEYFDFKLNDSGKKTREEVVRGFFRNQRDGKKKAFLIA